MSMPSVTSEGNTNHLSRRRLNPYLQDSLLYSSEHNALRGSLESSILLMVVMSTARFRKVLYICQRHSGVHTIISMIR